MSYVSDYRLSDKSEREEIEHRLNKHKQNKKKRREIRHTYDGYDVRNYRRPLE